MRRRGMRVRRLLAVAGIVAAFIAIWALASAVSRSSAFQITRVEVLGENRLTEAQVLARAKIADHATLLNFGRDHVAARVAADPWIRSVRVVRDFPHTVRIDITERTPEAIVDAGGDQVWIVSSDGRWLGKKTALDADLTVIENVPRIHPRAGVAVREAAVRNAIAVLVRLSPELRTHIAAVSAPTVEETALRTDKGVEILFGEATSVSHKTAVILGILNGPNRAVQINVRVPGKETWRGIRAP